MPYVLNFPTLLQTLQATALLKGDVCFASRSGRCQSSIALGPWGLSASCQESMMEEAHHLMAATERKGKGLESHHPKDIKACPKICPSDLKLPSGPHPLKVPQPVNRTKLETKPLTHGHSNLLLILPSRLNCQFFTNKLPFINNMFVLCIMSRVLLSFVSFSPYKSKHVQYRKLEIRKLKITFKYIWFSSELVLWQ